MTRRLLLILILLWTAAAYIPLYRNGLVSLDDPAYITANPHVITGLKLQNLRWAFEPHFYAGNYHPLTWISLQLDAAIWGERPLGYHLTNLLLHLANTALLFLLLARWSLWRAAAAALLWAVHPLRVESVAWAAERKDVLSAFFGLLAIRSYCGFRIADRGINGDCQSEIRNPKSAMFRVWLWMLLSLLCKPMLVTLPLLLVLLDHWPLNSPHCALGNPKSAILSKWPLWLISFLFCLITFQTQHSQGGVTALNTVPIAMRIANALHSAAAYLAMHLRVDRLAAYYPFIHNRPAALIALCAAVLLAITAAAILLGRRRPWLAVGWGWYVLLLLPVVGIVQIGTQGMADRYTYLPCIGLLVAAIWMPPESWWRNVKIRPAIIGLVAVIAGIWTGFTARQIGYWRDDAALFSRVLSVSGDTPLAHYSLGAFFAQSGRTDRAVEHYQQALATPEGQFPGFGIRWRTLNNLAIHYAESGRLDDALALLRQMLDLTPDSVEIRLNMAILLGRLGRRAEADAQWSEAHRRNPQHPQIPVVLKVLQDLHHPPKP